MPPSMNVICFGHEYCCSLFSIINPMPSSRRRGFPMPITPTVHMVLHKGNIKIMRAAADTGIICSDKHLKVKLNFFFRFIKKRRSKGLHVFLNVVVILIGGNDAVSFLEYAVLIKGISVEQYATRCFHCTWSVARQRQSLKPNAW